MLFGSSADEPEPAVLVGTYGRTVAPRPALPGVADDQLNLSFSGRDRSPLMRRLAAMAAPLAVDSGSVVDDEQTLAVARAVCAAFSHDDAIGGLTKAEITARVNGACDPATLESRLGVFVRMEMLRPIHDKKHQQRYVLAPAGLVGVMIVDRFSERGGVEELLSLLDRTRTALERHDADAPAVAAALESCRAMFAVFANALAMLVVDAPLPELLEERRFHDDRGFIEHVAALQRLVTDAFPALDPAAYKLLVEAQRYVERRRGSDQPDPRRGRRRDQPAAARSRAVPDGGAHRQHRRARDGRRRSRVRPGRAVGRRR